MRVAISVMVLLCVHDNEKSDKAILSLLYGAFNIECNIHVNEIQPCRPTNHGRMSQRIQLHRCRPEAGRSLFNGNAMRGRARGRG